MSVFLAAAVLGDVIWNTWQLTDGKARAQLSLQADETAARLTLLNEAGKVIWSAP